MSGEDRHKWENLTVHSRARLPVGPSGPLPLSLPDTPTPKRDRISRSRPAQMKIHSRGTLRWILQQELPEASALLDLAKPWLHILHAQRSRAGFVYSFHRMRSRADSPLGMCPGAPVQA